MPAGTSAAASEDRTQVVRHPTPASLVARVCDSDSYDSQQRLVISGVHRHQESFTLFLQVKNEVHFCGEKKKVSTTECSNNRILKKQYCNPDDFFF